MADPSFDQLAATTLADLRDDIVQDNFFVKSEWMRKMRNSGGVRDFLGGTLMQEPFQYNRVQGGAIAPGTDVTVEQVPIIAAMGFVPKEYIEKIALNLFQTNVLQGAGTAVKIKLIDAYMVNAMDSLDTDISIDFWNHGQNVTGSNRINFINGVAEALNDGVNPSWDGLVFTNYGGQLRNGAVGNVLNSVPIWIGDQAGNVGQLSYKAITESYLNCVQPPDIGSVNKAGFAYLLERQEPKQNFVMEKDIDIGVSGLKLFDAYIFMDKLVPSTKYGSLLPAGLSQTTSVSPAAFTTPTYTTGQNTISQFPSAISVNPGEPFFWLRIKDWQFRQSTDPEYNMNFTPIIRSQTNADLIVIFLKDALNLYTPSPRDNVQLVGGGY